MAAALLAVATTTLADTTPVGTTFTYQGRLVDAGEPVTEPVDLVFRLFDIDAGGTPLNTLVANDFAIGDDGRFTIDLDFGGAAFTGESRWLEIEVNEVVLSPRQPIMAAPHAMIATTAANVPTKAIMGSYGGITGVGTLNSLDVAGVATFGGQPTYVQVNGPLGHATLNNHLFGPILTLRNSSGSATSNLGKLAFEDTVGTKASIEYLNQAQGVNALRFLGADGAADMVITEAGIVGIGTTQPSTTSRLHVAGQVRVSVNSLQPAIDVSQTAIGSASAIHAHSLTQSSHGRAIMGQLLSSNPGFNAAGVLGQAGDVGHSSSGIGVRGFHKSGGIGVKGESSGTAVYGLATGNASGGVQYGVHGHSSSNNGYAGYFTGGRNYFEGRVGIGTDDPTFGQLVVQRTTSSVFAIEAYQDDLEYPAIYMHNLNGPAMWVESLSEASLTGPGAIVVGAVNGSGPNLGIDRNGIMARTTGDTAATLRLNPYGGNVQIGENSGGTGRLLTPVLEITGGSDLSERFDIAAVDDLQPQPGMVVCIDPANPGRLLPSTRAYDRTVAGIISGANGVNTGMIMGQQGSEADGAYAVALTGRVYVMADATRGAIEPGDLLTTSDRPGYAMPVDDYAQAQGAIIGKAMTSLSAGERGMVLVLVSLQ